MKALPAVTAAALVVIVAGIVWRRKTALADTGPTDAPTEGTPPLRGPLVQSDVLNAISRERDLTATANQSIGNAANAANAAMTAAVRAKTAVERNEVGAATAVDEANAAIARAQEAQRAAEQAARAAEQAAAVRVAAAQEAARVAMDLEPERLRLDSQRRTLESQWRADVLSYGLAATGLLALYRNSSVNRPEEVFRFVLSGDSNALQVFPYNGPVERVPYSTPRYAEIAAQRALAQQAGRHDPFAGQQFRFVSDAEMGLVTRFDRLLNTFESVSRARTERRAELDRVTTELAAITARVTAARNGMTVAGSASGLRTNPQTAQTLQLAVTLVPGGANSGTPAGV